MIHIEGVTPSADIRAQLAAEGQPLLLAFSCGKDALAAWVALEESGVGPIHPYYLYLVPELQFVEDALRGYEDLFGTPIARLPHPSLFRWLINHVFQPPERRAIIDAAKMIQPTYREVEDIYAAQIGLSTECWRADGVRAADSLNRRTSMKRNGPLRTTTRKASVVWDWRIQDVRDALSRRRIPLPPDYEWFGRSFDGLEARYLIPMSKHAPEDFRRVLDWFPLAELELIRDAL